MKTKIEIIAMILSTFLLILAFYLGELLEIYFILFLILGFIAICVYLYSMFKLMDLTDQKEQAFEQIAVVMIFSCEVESRKQ